MVETAITGGISEMLDNRLYLGYESKRRVEDYSKFFFFSLRFMFI